MIGDNARNDKVQLGCGTLLLIALIVMIFSGSQGVREVSSSVEALDKKIERLETKLDVLATRLEQQGHSAAQAESTTTSLQKLE